MKNQSGFTLIEIVVSLVLVGMMAAIAGMGIVTGTRGYLFAKQNSHMAQKAQIAMARIQRELMELTAIAARQVDPAFIIYDNTTGRHAIARDGNYVKMYDLNPGAMTIPVDQGDILIDNVNDFTLDYFQGANAWGGTDIQLLSAIQANLVMDRTDDSGDTVTFTTTVNPRNTNNFGGLPPDTTPYTAHNYTCFVATAADGYLTGSLIPFLSLIMVILVLFFLPQKYKDVVAGKLEDLKAWKLKSRSALKPLGLPAFLLRRSRGNVLIGLIVTMMIFAALGAGMVAMTGTSTSSQVTANTTSKAYYLAESGFRYLASQYLNENDTDTDGEIEDDRNQILLDHHGQTFTLINPDERFNLDIRPYYRATTASFPIGSISIGTMFPGQGPAGFTIPNTGRLNIGSDIYNYTDYSDITGIFTLSAGLLQPVGSRMNVLLVGVPSGAGNMTNGGNLTLVDASFFPAITGKFMINGIAYTYANKSGNTLENITDANDPDRVFSLPVDANTNLILKPYLRVHSTGTVGQGDEAASRIITYNASIPDHPTQGETVEFYDTFEDTAAWQASTWGSHSVQNIGGSALRVTGTQSVSGAPKASLIGFDWSTTNANLGSAHSLSGGFLSYDAQVKVGFNPPFTPGSWGDADPITNGPDGLPKYYAAGLSFRLDQNLNSYGVSFMRGSNFTNPLPDNIDPNIVPQDQVPMIVLWQQINSGADRNWLAYKYLTGPVIWFDDMESGAPGWTENPQPLDTATPPWWLSPFDSYSPSTMWSDRTGPYLNNEDASLISPSIDLTGHTSAVLTFWHDYAFSDAGDSGRVYINGNEIASFVGPSSTSDWTKVAIDISEYIPNNVQITFRIQTDGAGTDMGWHIDDVAISETFPVNESTLLVRIKEAAELRFDSGGTTEIVDGDIITQANGARGTVVGNPVLSAGTWAAGNAAGIITINNVSGTFANGQALLVGGTNLATNLNFTARNNYIKVFYGDVNGNGTANNDPFDLERSPSLRDEVQWPTDEIQDWSAERDFFTLVQWDAVNAVDIIESIDEPDVIVLGTESSLFTPESGILSYNRPELGLHTFGHGSTEVYFDDFAIQVEIASGSGFLTPIQE
jgi:prepilin-type N-terminal cleavage/methylation domain-containing protein